MKRYRDLTPVETRNIRRVATDKTTIRRLAKAFNCNRSAILKTILKTKRQNVNGQIIITPL